MKINNVKVTREGAINAIEPINYAIRCNGHIEIERFYRPYDTFMFVYPEYGWDKEYDLSDGAVRYMVDEHTRDKLFEEDELDEDGWYYGEEY